MLLTCLALLIVLFIIYRCYDYLFPSPNIDARNKYVLISGCDTGVGRALALQLDKRGFHVLAGVFSLESIPALSNALSTRATVFRMDITKQADIDAALELVQKQTTTLHALVNNAGIITHGCIDWTSMEILRRVMEVNFFGHVAVTKTFLPLLIAKRHCRVVNVCSATGFFAFPNTSAYSASKHAVEAFSDCLRREMNPWRLHVSVIEPGTLRTAMTDGYEKNLRSLWNGLATDIQDRWGTEFLESIIDQSVNSPFIRHADDPLGVVRAIEHAVMSTSPQLRYLPGWQSKVIYFVFYMPPVWLIDKLLAKALHFVPAELRKRRSD